MYKDLCVVFAEGTPPACVGVVVIVKGTEGWAVPSRCDVNSDKKCVVSWFSLESGVPVFFFNVFFIFFIIFFGRVEVVGVDKVWVKIKGGSLVGFVDTTRWSPCTALANLGFISHWHCLFLDWMIVDHCMCSYVLACSVANVCFVWAKSDIYLLCHVLYSYICDKSQRDYKIRKE